MNEVKPIWMGLGIFERLYAENKIQSYFDVLEKLPNKKVFILADEITGTNNFVLSSKKFDLKKYSSIHKKQIQKSREKFEPRFEFIERLIKSSRNSQNWSVYYWNFLSSDPEFKKIYDDIHEVIKRFENHYLKKEILKITIFGFGARMRKNFTNSFVDFVFDKNFYRYLETLSEYTIEELVAIFYLAKKGYIKAGHDEEKPYDELALMFYERFKEEESFNVQPEFYYI
ncbi:MAG: hypothetical protein HYV41_04250 [Candidatus Magasanikbacteria bacterium]|nr:hypothetical protein [Candidatus Magasanikbacteria bacterium]